MSKYNRNNKNRNKKYEDLTFEQKLELFLEQSKENSNTLSKRYNRQADSRKVRKKNKGKGDV